MKRVILTFASLALCSLGPASADCGSPANGEYWTAQEMQDFYDLYIQFLQCCCVNNIVGSWESTGIHTAVIPGCDCPSVPATWVCFQIQTFMMRQVEATSFEGSRLPAPPPGGYGTNDMATRATQIDCNCTDGEGNPVGPDPACLINRTRYVPVLAALCIDC